MGEVFRARHRVLEREDAVKRILPGRLDSPDAVERFLREAKAAARLRHPNVVHVYDANWRPDDDRRDAVLAGMREIGGAIRGYDGG